LQVPQTALKVPQAGVGCRFLLAFAQEMAGERLPRDCAWIYAQQHYGTTPSGATAALYFKLSAFQED